jgi:hypothetical protein
MPPRGDSLERGVHEHADLNAAIRAHQGEGSEANTVVDNFDDLETFQQQEVLDFLRSL